MPDKRSAATKKNPKRKPKIGKPRAMKAGEKLGVSIVEAVHLMYQNNTAVNFLNGLMHILSKEYQRRVGN